MNPTELLVLIDALADGDGDAVASFRKTWAGLTAGQKQAALQWLHTQGASEDNEERASAYFKLLAATDTEQGLKSLMEIARQNDDLSWEAVAALEVSEFDGLAVELVGVLDDDDLTDAAKHVLEERRPPQAVLPLIELMKGQRSPMQLELLACCAKGSEHAATAIKAIGAHLDTDSKLTRSGAYDALAVLGPDVRQVPGLVSRLESDASSEDSWTAIHALGVLARIEGLDSAAGRARGDRMVGFLAAKSADTRNSALVTLGRLAPDIEPCLINGLTGGDSRLRDKVREAVARIMPRREPISAALQAALADAEKATPQKPAAVIPVQSPEQIRAAVRERTGTTLPDLYLRLVAEDAFAHFGCADLDAWRKRGAREPFDPILSAYDVEWLFPTDVAAVRREDFWIEDLVLVPFAHNGAGDLYCWSPSHEENGAVPVVLAPHDEMNATILAADFQGFIDRCAIEQSARFYGVKNRDEALALAKKLFDRVAPYLSDVARNAVEELCAREPKPSHNGDMEFASYKETQATVKHVLDNPLVGVEFPLTD